MPLPKDWQKTIEQWKSIRNGKKFTDFYTDKEIVNIFPQRGKIDDFVPMTKQYADKKYKKNSQNISGSQIYRGKLIEKLENIQREKGYEKITELYCYLYVIFRHENAEPDIDNLLKTFFDAFKEVFLKDDKQILGIKSNRAKVPNAKQAGIWFTLIPAYELKVEHVHEIKTEKGMDKLNELRAEYSKSLGHRGKQTEWKMPMQMVKTNYGTFFDNREGNLPGIKYYGKSYGREIEYKPEPGFNWKAKERKEVEGVMIYERSGCWWINKWAEE